MKLKLQIILLILLLIGVQNIFGQTITNFTPKSGPVGTTIFISGSGFNVTASNNIIFFGATQATVTNATSTSLTAIVPAGATFAPITVLNAITGLSGMSNQFYNPTFTPNKGNIKQTDIALKVDFATGFMPNSVKMGDLNGDGKPEIVTANATNGPDISILRNTSTNGIISFATKVEFAIGGQPNSVAIADLNGDGKLDIATANPVNGNISILRNTSSGGNISFAAKVDYPNVQYCMEIIPGDINGDGKVDLITVNQFGSSTISVLKNTSIGNTISFAPKVNFATGINPQTLSIGDLDGDNKLDVVVGNDANMSILRNNSTTNTINFSAKVDYYTPGRPYSIAIGDIDGDGKLDLGIANHEVEYPNGIIGDSLTILRNTSNIGTISFASRVNYAIVPKSISIGDINGDGKPDFSIVNKGGDMVSILQNISDSGHISLVPIIGFYTGSNPHSVCIGDLNADGKPDIAVSNSSITSNSVSVFKNNPIFPEILVSSNLSSFSTCYGNNSPSQNFTIRGRFLDSNIHITAPLGFEISTNSVSGYGSNITLVKSVDSVALTTIYVRLTNNSSGTPTGNISCSSIWAITQNIGVSGLVKPLSNSTNNLSICSSELPYTWNGLTFDNAGTKTKSGLINSVGCDSSATLTLAIRPTTFSTTRISICPNELPFNWNGLTFDSAGTKLKSGFSNSVGCDSSAILILSIKPTSSSTNYLSICPSELPYSWNGLTFNGAETKTKLGLVNSAGCDSSASLTLSLKQTSTSTNNLSICPSELPLVWNGLTFNNAGTKTKSGLINSVGCDSSATLNLNINPKPIVSSIIGPQNGIFPLTNYTYIVSQQTNVSYNWIGTNSIIVSGQETNSIIVQFLNPGISKIKVELTNLQGCSDSSILSLNVVSVGLNNLEKTNSIIIYPNPTSNKLNINVDEKIIGSNFKLIDFTGRVLLTGTIQNQNEIIDLDNFPSGIYLINFTDNFDSSFKIFKQ